MFACNQFLDSRVLVLLTVFFGLFAARSFQTQSGLKGISPMKHTCRSARELGGLLAAVCVLAVVVVTLGAMAVRAEKPEPSQTPAAAQTPSPARTGGGPAQISPIPTPTPVNWSSDPMLKRFVFRGIGPASMGGRIDDIACVETNSYICYIAA